MFVLRLGRLAVGAMGWMGALLALSACGSDSSFSSLDPQLEVFPPDGLDFGRVVANEESGLATFEIANAGRRDLTVALALGGDDAASFAVEGELDLVVEAATATEVQVSFVPDAVRSFAGLVEFTTNDPETPQATLDLAGKGASLESPTFLRTKTASTLARSR